MSCKAAATTSFGGSARGARQASAPQRMLVLVHRLPIRDPSDAAMDQAQNVAGDIRRFMMPRTSWPWLASVQNVRWAATIQPAPCARIASTEPSEAGPRC
jgi:hypothetical protein